VECLECAFCACVADGAAADELADRHHDTGGER
jgi:hypothetical protein